MPIFKRTNVMDQLHLRFRSAYEFSRSPAAHKAPMVTPSTIIWIVLSGVKFVKVNNRFLQIQAGSLVVFPPQLRLEFMYADEPFHFFSLACHAKVGAFDFVNLFKVPYVTKIENFEEIERITADWKKLIGFARGLENVLNPDRLPKGSSGNEVQHTSEVLNTDQSIRYLRLHACLSQLFTDLLELISFKLPESPVSFDPRIDDTCNYIKNHLTERLDVDILSKRVYISPSHLRYLFRQALGMPPSEYIRQTRLHRARELLLLTNYPISDIAEMVGFDNQRRFGRVFMQAYDMSPIDFRRTWKVL